MNIAYTNFDSASGDENAGKKLQQVQDIGIRSERVTTSDCYTLPREVLFGFDSRHRMLGSVRFVGGLHR